MCMEDIRIGRKSRTATRLVTLANATDTPIVGADALRVSITFATAGANAVITPDGSNKLSNAGFVIGVTLPPITLHVDTQGDLVTRPFTGFGVAGAVDVLVSEAFLDAY